jgi:hypothetical protein
MISNIISVDGDLNLPLAEKLKNALRIGSEVICIGTQIPRTKEAIHLAEELLSHSSFRYIVPKRNPAETTPFETANLLDSAAKYASFGWHFYSRSANFAIYSEIIFEQLPRLHLEFDSITFEQPNIRRGRIENDFIALVTKAFLVQTDTIVNIANSMYQSQPLRAPEGFSKTIYL